jgi:hypothetical protein
MLSAECRPGLGIDRIWAGEKNRSSESLRDKGY